MATEVNKKLLDSSDETTGKETTGKTSESSESSGAFCQVFFDILKNGILGACVFLLLMTSLLVTFLYAGRLPSSETFISAMGVGCAYYGVGSSIAFGLNAGFNVLSSRCHSLKAYTHCESFLKKQVSIMNVFNIVLLLFVVVCLFWFDAVYSHQPSLLYWTRVFMICGYPCMVLLFNIDIFREMFIGLQIFIQTFIAEIVVVVSSGVMSYVFCFV